VGGDELERVEKAVQVARRRLLNRFRRHYAAIGDAKQKVAATLEEMRRAGFSVREEGKAIEKSHEYVRAVHNKSHKP
jgi:hypothetical protein